MVRRFKLFKNQYLGFWALGLLLFAIQEIPYMIMPFITLSTNPIMTMTESSVILNIIEKILGSSSIAIMCFIVHKEADLFSLGTGIHRLGFILAIVFLLGYYLGWAIYFSGIQSFEVMMYSLVAMPPLYYTAIGLWRKNWLLVIVGFAFLLVHFIHVYGNLTM